MTSHLNLKVDSALKAVESFSALLEKETDALKASDYETFKSLQDSKVTLAHAYQDAVLAFEADIDILKSMDESRKNLLRAAHARFTTAATANQAVLKATGQVADRIVKLIMNAARQTVMDGPSYSAAGHNGLSDKLPVHFKLNETI